MNNKEQAYLITLLTSTADHCAAAAAAAKGADLDTLELLLRQSAKMLMMALDATSQVEWRQASTSASSDLDQQ